MQVLPPELVNAWGDTKNPGQNLLIAVVYDRNYRSTEHIEDVHKKLEASTAFVQFHSGKEIEHYLLIPSVFR